MKFGKIRERPKIERMANNDKSKMIISYINHKDAKNAIEAFDQSAWVREYQNQNVRMRLNYYHTKENRIYVIGLKDGIEKDVEDTFSIFGKVTEIQFGKLKNGANTAIIGYAEEY